MTKRKGTKSALFSSALSLFLCFTMLLGTTFAWFTDTVTSSGNIIQTGKLDVAMYYADGSKAVPADNSSDWKDASDVAIFNHGNWEPGYVDAKHIKVSNIGTLALKYQMRIVANGVISELADVIDVYYFADSTDTPLEALTRDKVEGATKLGTLTEVLGTGKNISNTANGELLPGESQKATLAFKMQESAGNEYQDMDLGCDFSIQIIATQYSYESDSIDKGYDAIVPNPELPAALVRRLSNLNVSTNGPLNGSIGGVDLSQFGVNALDVGYQFEPTSSYEDAQNSDYRYWHADFVVSADSAVAANSLALAGYYDAWCQLNEDAWIALVSPDSISANTEIRLVEALGSGSITVNWEELCLYGNDGKGFQCGAVDIDGSNEGTTLTVELRLYKTYSEEEAEELGYGKTTNVETGEYITLGTFTHTFGGEWETLDDNSVVFFRNNGEVLLYDTQNVDTETYYVPDGVTTLGNYCMSYNNTIKEVVLSDTVTSLGRAFDSNSTLKKVVLNEGLETIDSRAFKATTALEEVVISSTVKTIADNAFQKSGIKTITIPATVETIGETAFGASLIETVIFEGNTSVQGYAFRGCPNLRTVYLNGDDNTFIASTLNGRNSTWFCNGESNNSGTSNITFYVQNETVADRVKAAMGAEIISTDNLDLNAKTIKIVVPTQETVTITTPTGEELSANVVISEQALNSFVTHGEMNPHASAYKNHIASITVYSKADFQAAYDLWKAGIYVHNGQNDVSPILLFGADIDFGGAEFEGFGKEFVIDGQGHTLSNIHFVMPEGMAKAGLIPYSGNTTIKNLTVKNASVTGAQAGIFGGNVENSQVENCALEGNIVINWVSYTATYNEDANGVGAVWGVTSGADATKNTVDIDITNANIVFNKDGISYPAGIEAESNNMVGVAYNGSSYDLTVNGAYYVSSDDELAAAVAAGKTNLYLADGEYDLAGLGGKIVTISGSKKAVIKIKNEGENGHDAGCDGATITFNGVTFDSTENAGQYRGFTRMSATYNDCAFIGSYTTSSGVHAFYNCSFDLRNNYVWTWGASDVIFDTCTFEDANGVGKAILVHEGAEVTNVTVRNCDFTASTAAYTWDGLYVAAVSIDPNGASKKITVNFEGTNTVNVADGAAADTNGNTGFAGLHQIKYANESAQVTVTIGGEAVENIVATDYNPNL